MSEPGGDSIVLVSTESADAVERFLSSYAGPHEVVVVGRREVDRPSPPGVRWVDADPRLGVPRLRRVGLEAASGRLVIFTEDSVVPGAGWPDGLDSVGIGTGPVACRAEASAWDRAVYLFEYGEFSPARRSPPSRLVGNNFALPREAAESLGDEIHEHEVPFAPRSFVSAATVVHVRRYGVVEAVRDRFRFGFAYGSRRWRRVPRALGLPLVPAVAAAQGRRMGRLRDLPEFRPAAVMIPLLSALVAAWSLGEGLGLLFGRRSETSARTKAREGSSAGGCRSGRRTVSPGT